MAIFDFPYHTFQTQNPESSTSLQLGSGYVFAAPPSDPDQRIITLHFQGMKYFTDEFGIVTDLPKPEINFYRLIKFYQEHKMWKTFQYNHPVHGLMSVRFYKPLIEPEVIKGGFGVVKDFEIQLVEVL